MLRLRENEVNDASATCCAICIACSVPLHTIISFQCSKNDTKTWKTGISLVIQRLTQWEGLQCAVGYYIFVGAGQMSIFYNKWNVCPVSP